jgi:WD repeat-containing protein 68
MDVEGTAPGARHVYETPWPAYSLAWSANPKASHRLAVGSCIEHDANQIHVIELNEESGNMELQASVEHSLAPTKLMWRPLCSDSGGSSDLLASTSTTLQVFKYEEGSIELKAKMANTRTAGSVGHLPPLTSFDWSSANPNKIGASSVDTTCTIWNLERQKIETQLIAHDKAVYDIAFSHHEALFATVGADGSVRLFDQRNLDHSTILYETTPVAPLLRIAWNKLNPNYLCTVAVDSPGVILIDFRRPSTALAGLSHKESCVNSICWAPHSRDHLLAGADDGSCLIWDVKEVPAGPQAADQGDSLGREKRPLVAYNCDHEVYQVQWPIAQPDFVALGMAKQVTVLQV